MTMRCYTTFLLEVTKESEVNCQRAIHFMDRMEDNSSQQATFGSQRSFSQVCDRTGQQKIALKPELVSFPYWFFVMRTEWSSISTVVKYDSCQIRRESTQKQRW